MSRTSEGEAVRHVFPPPFIYLFGLLAGILIDRRWSRTPAFPEAKIGYVLGSLVAASGIGLIVRAVATMAKSGENPEPQVPTNAIVVAGPYRFSRNPIYLGFTLAYLGVSFLVNTVWPLVLLPGVQTVVHYGVVLREERYLEARLGEEYRRYRASVRRWI